jgi:hypothetical protein
MFCLFRDFEDTVTCSLHIKCFDDDHLGTFVHVNPVK